MDVRPYFKVDFWYILKVLTARTPSNRPSLSLSLSQGWVHTLKTRTVRNHTFIEAVRNHT